MKVAMVWTVDEIGPQKINSVVETRNEPRCLTIITTDGSSHIMWECLKHWHIKDEKED